MIKLLALLTMLIDHIGVILLKEIIIFRLIGRLAMPLYAYCIARGFYFSKQHGTLKKYISNILALTLISEIPYCLIVQYPAINIGFTWLSAITILFVLESNMDRPKKYLVAWFIVVFAYGLDRIISFDYGVYGVITAVAMYYLMVKQESPVMMFIVSISLWIFYILFMNISFEQIYAVFAVLFIVLLNPFDDVIKVPKRVYYWFYPLHMMILLFIGRMLPK
ncbi:TraX family protein [Oribacterium sp. FC2011]|uniref:TraX family protein n=1 Tax=Oribacterium sp. FC2011 TaxID=1408311 RepID=UPI0004E1DAAD|nr:TraX family protein [Oribacterium sp. FC2011]